MKRALLVLVACGDNVGPRILFVHGGHGTGGFVENGSDDELSSITDDAMTPNNHGYGELAQLLRADGFALDEISEQPNEPIDLVAADLSRYAIVFFASNNAVYSPADASLVGDYVFDGGGALFVSDANWGSFWDKAPTSDQAFLTQFGLIMNQDGEVFSTLAGGDLLDPTHPIFAGVASIQGEGVSPCTLSHDPAAVARPVRLAVAQGMVKRNTAPDGPLTPATGDDGSVFAVDYGRGRVACSFDRNTFFNTNGTGTNLAQVDNRTYAHNLFAWLARRI